MMKYCLLKLHSVSAPQKNNVPKRLTRRAERHQKIFVGKIKDERLRMKIRQESQTMADGAEVNGAHFTAQCWNLFSLI